MFVTSRTSIGIEITSSEIIITKSKSGKVVKVAVGKIPDGVFDNTYLENKELLIEAVKSTMKCVRIRGGKCSLCLSNAEVIVRVFELPEMTNDQIEQNVMYEIADHLMVDISLYQVDYRVLTTTETDTGNILTIAAIASQKKTLNEYKYVLKKCGFKVKNIDVSFNVLEKLIFMATSGQIESYGGNSIAVLDFGSSRTKVSIYKNGTFAVVRKIDTGIETIMNDLAITTGDDKRRIVSMVESGRLFESDDEDNIIRRMFFQRLDNLIDEIAISFDFYNSKSIHNQLSKVYLTGFYSRIDGLKNYVSNTLGEITVNYLSELLLAWSTAGISRHINVPVEIWANAYGSTLMRKEQV